MRALGLLGLASALLAASTAIAAEGARGQMSRDAMFELGPGAPQPQSQTVAQAPAPQAARYAPVAPVPSINANDGYRPPPNSIEGYNADSDFQRRQYASVSGPTPLPPRFNPSIVPAAPAPAQGQPTIAPSRGPAAASKPARTRKIVKGAAPKIEEAPAPPAQEPVEQPKPAPFIAFDAGMTTTTRGQLVNTVGVTAALNGSLEKSGMRAHGEAQGIVACCFGKPKDSPLPKGVALSSSVLLGYEHVAEKGTVSGYLGVDIQNTQAPTDDGLGPWVRKTHVGLQVSGDAYYNPTENLMASTSVSFSTHNLSYFMRTKFGVAIADGVFVGPEVGAVGNKNNRQLRVGAHISGVKVGAVQFGLAAGYAADHKKGEGAYVILDSRVTF